MSSESSCRAKPVPNVPSTARRLAKEIPGAYYPDQYNNPDNVRAHYETTGPEIYRQTDGEVDYFVAGMGTTGTLMGLSRRLKEFQPGVRIVGVEPYLGHRLQGQRFGGGDHPLAVQIGHVEGRRPGSRG